MSYMKLADKLEIFVGNSISLRKVCLVFVKWTLAVRLQNAILVFKITGDELEFERFQKNLLNELLGM